MWHEEILEKRKWAAGEKSEERKPIRRKYA